MRESLGKTKEREIFFRQYVPTVLPQALRQTGNVLILQGEYPRELPYLDELGFQRNRVISIENEVSVYLKQAIQNDAREAEQKISISYGDMRDFLKNRLNSGTPIVLLRLDVEGSYVSQLDPAMTWILLFGWRNPSTVVATYHSARRDQHMLWEGVKSVAILNTIAPTATRQMLQCLRERYLKSGFGTESATSMVLRDCFWLRSVWEHTLVASESVGAIQREIVEQLFLLERQIWQLIREERRVPLELNQIESLLAQKLDENSHALFYLPLIELELASIRHVVYRAAHPWVQLAHYATFSLSQKPISSSEWLTNAVALLLQPLVYIDRAGNQYDKSMLTRLSHRDFPLWDRLNIYNNFKPRELELISPTPQVVHPKRPTTEVEPPSQSVSLAAVAQVDTVIEEKLTMSNQQSKLKDIVQGIGGSFLEEYQELVRRAEAGDAALKRAERLIEGVERQVRNYHGNDQQAATPATEPVIAPPPAAPPASNGEALTDLSLRLLRARVEGEDAYDALFKELREGGRSANSIQALLARTHGKFTAGFVKRAVADLKGRELDERLSELARLLSAIDGKRWTSAKLKELAGS